MQMSCLPKLAPNATDILDMDVSHKRMCETGRLSLSHEWDLQVCIRKNPGCIGAWPLLMHSNAVLAMRGWRHYKKNVRILYYWKTIVSGSGDDDDDDDDANDTDDNSKYM